MQLYLISYHAFPSGHNYSLEADVWIQYTVGSWYGSRWNSHTGCSPGYTIFIYLWTTLASLIYFGPACVYNIKACFNSFIFTSMPVMTTHETVNLLSQSSIFSQVVVEKKLMREQKLTRHDVGRERFVDEVSSTICSVFYFLVILLHLLSLIWLYKFCIITTSC